MDSNIFKAISAIKADHSVAEDAVAIIQAQLKKNILSSSGIDHYDGLIIEIANDIISLSNDLMMEANSAMLKELKRL